AYKRYLPLMTGASIVGSIYALYTFFHLGLPRAAGLGVTENGLGSIAGFFTITMVGYALSQKGSTRGVFAWVASVLSVGAVLVSFSRGAWAGLLVSAVLFIGMAF